MGDRVLSNSQKIIWDCAQFSAATVVSQGVGLIRALIIPVLLSPGQLGIWNLMNVVVAYGGNGHLGLLHGMNKMIPTLRGQGQDQLSEVTKDSAFWFNVFLSSGWLGFVLLASLVVSTNYAAPLRITAVIIFLLGLFNYFYSLLRADSRFQIISIGVGGLSILTVILIGGFGYFLPDPLEGALLGFAAAYGMIVLYWFLTGKYHFIFRINRRTLIQAFVMGFPLLALGLLDSLLLSVDRWVIVSTLGETKLGYYALCIMASNLIGLVPVSIASVLYPRMLERYGSDGNPSVMRSLFDGPTRAVTAFMGLLIGGCVLTLPVLIRFLLPEYIPSIPLLNILLPAVFFYASTFIAGNFIVAINRQKFLIVIQVLAILSAIVLDLIVVKMGYGVIGVAWSTAVVYAIYGCGYMFMAAYFVFEQGMERVRFLIDIYGIFMAMALGLVFVLNVFPVGETFGTALLFSTFQFAIFAVILCPAIWWSNRHGDLISIVRELVIKRLKGTRF